MAEYALGVRRFAGTPSLVVWLDWAQVAEVLGHEHAGSAADDEALVDWLRAQGAPDWVAQAPGWMDENHWGLRGPEVDEADLAALEEAYAGEA
jgi:hypothetical protein